MSDTTQENRCDNCDYKKWNPPTNDVWQAPHIVREPGITFELPQVDERRELTKQVFIALVGRNLGKDAPESLYAAIAMNLVDELLDMLP